MATITVDAFICGGQVAGLIAARTIAEKGYKVFVQEWTNELGGMCVAGVLQVDYSGTGPVGRARDFWLAVKAYAESQGKVWDGTNAPGGLYPLNGLPRNVSPLWVLHAINTTLINHANITVVKSADILKINKNADGTRFESFELSSGDTVVVGARGQWTDYSYESWLAAHDDSQIPHDYGRLDREQFDEVNSGNAVFNATIDDDFPICTVDGDLHRHRTHRPQQEDGKGSLTTMGFNHRYMMSTRANRRPWSTLQAPLLAVDYRPELFSDFISELKQRNAGAIGFIASAHEVDGTYDDGLHTTNPTNLNEIMLARKYPRIRTPAEARAFKDEMFLATAGKIYAAYTSTELNAGIATALAKFGLPGEVYQTNYWRAPGWPPQHYTRSCRRGLGQHRVTWKNFREIPPDPAFVAGYNADSHQHFYYRDPVTGYAVKEGSPEPHTTGAWLVPWRYFKPFREHCTNGLLGWNGSESYIMSTDMRIESIKMMQAEVAGIAIAESLRQGIDVVDLPYASLRPLLIAAGFVLTV